jgi:hypothetical protein
MSVVPDVCFHTCQTCGRDWWHEGRGPHCHLTYRSRCSACCVRLGTAAMLNQLRRN